MNPSNLITSAAISSLRTELDLAVTNLVNSQEDIANVQGYADARIQQIIDLLTSRLASTQAGLIEQIRQATVEIIDAIPAPIAPPAAPSILPIGSIIMYSGPTSVFPGDGAGTGAFAEFALCNGATHSLPNGGSVTVADLIGKFVVAGEVIDDSWMTDLVNENGSASGGNSTITLNEAQLPAHRHNLIMEKWFAHGSTNVAGTSTKFLYGLTRNPWNPAELGGNHSNHEYDTLQGNSTNAAGVQASGDGSEIEPISIVPPFVAIAFIQKIKETYGATG